MTPPDCPHFEIASRFTFDARPEELTAIVLAPEELHRWCTPIFMNTVVLDRGAPDGLGMTVKLHTKGWLPFTFYFVARIVDLEPHRWMAVEVRGDFEGLGRLTVEPQPDGRTCHARLHWTIRVNQPYLRPVLGLFRWLYRINHKWAMRQAERMLQGEVDRRRRGDADRVAEAPVFPHNFSTLRRWARRSDTDHWAEG